MAARGGRRCGGRDRRSGSLRGRDAAGVRLLDGVGAGPDVQPGRRRLAPTGLRPARHGQRARGDGHDHQIHLLSSRVGPPFQSDRCRTDRRATLWSGRQRDPTGLGPQPRARWACDPLPRCRGRSGCAPRVVRRGAGEPGLRFRAGRTIARSSDRSIRPDGLAVRSHRVGSRIAARDTRSGGDPRLLRALWRADEPGEALPGARPERRTECEWLGGAVDIPGGKPSAAPSVSASPS